MRFHFGHIFHNIEHAAENWAIHEAEGFAVHAAEGIIGTLI